MDIYTLICWKSCHEYHPFMDLPLGGGGYLAINLSTSNSDCYWLNIKYHHGPQKNKNYPILIDKIIVAQKKRILILSRSMCGNPDLWFSTQGLMRSTFDDDYNEIMWLKKSSTNGT